MTLTAPQQRLILAIVLFNLARAAYLLVLPNEGTAAFIKGATGLIDIFLISPILTILLIRWWKRNAPATAAKKHWMRAASLGINWPILAMALRSLLGF